MTRKEKTTVINPLMHGPFLGPYGMGYLKIFGVKGKKTPARLGSVQRPPPLHAS